MSSLSLDLNIEVQESQIDEKQERMEGQQVFPLPSFWSSGVGLYGRVELRSGLV